VASTCTGVVHFSREYMMDLPATAMATLGLSALWRSEGFTRRGPSVLAGALLGLTLRTKTLTGALFLGPSPSADLCGCTGRSARSRAWASLHRQRPWWPRRRTAPTSARSSTPLRLRGGIGAVPCGRAHSPVAAQPLLLRGDPRLPGSGDLARGRARLRSPRRAPEVPALAARIRSPLLRGPVPVDLADQRLS
jgi:hypothetical protein